MFANVGLHYGPAHQGIVAIYLGEKQLLAQLRLPPVVETRHERYVLHPSMMDSALQASIGLVVDSNHIPSKPSIPFLLESARIVSACAKEMVAWVRYAEGSQPEDKTIKLDIDLCDLQGVVCVQMRGFTSRGLESEVTSRHLQNILPDDHPNSIENATFDDAFYQKLVADVMNRKVSVAEAVELG
jgi:acyl transferase domain-containing protein